MSLRGPPPPLLRHLHPPILLLSLPQLPPVLSQRALNMALLEAEGRDGEGQRLVRAGTCKREECVRGTLLGRFVSRGLRDFGFGGSWSIVAALGWILRRQQHRQQMSRRHHHHLLGSPSFRAAIPRGLPHLVLPLPRTAPLPPLRAHFQF